MSCPMSRSLNQVDVEETRAETVERPALNPHCALESKLWSSMYSTSLLQTCLSKVLHRRLNKEIGRKLSGVFGEETLGTGVIRAIFHSLGTTPDLRDLLNNKVKPGAIAPAVNFNMWGEILSGPLDLVTFRETSRSKTYSSVHKRSSENKSGQTGERNELSASRGGTEVLKQDTKNSLRRLAFSILDSATVEPLDKTGMEDGESFNIL